MQVLDHPAVDSGHAAALGDRFFERRDHPLGVGHLLGAGSPHVVGDLHLTEQQQTIVIDVVREIRSRLQFLVEVGLGYLTLNRESGTLSGGEAQRIKLAKELSKRATGRTIYILDEPTTGLHFADVHKLLDVLQRLVTLGNTVLVIEHNLDVIKSADYIIDLGPEGGEQGGRVVAAGTPEEVARSRKSHTGQVLKPLLNGSVTRNGNSHEHSNDA